MLPLYEAKMIHHYDHRWATYEPNGTTRDVTLEEKQDPEFVVVPRYWLRELDVSARLEGRWDRDWLLGWRDICRSTDERTMIASRFDLAAAPDGTLLMLPDVEPQGLIACLCSFVYDFATRQKVGGTHLKFFTVYQTPVLPPSAFDGRATWDSSVALRSWISERVDWLQSHQGWRDMTSRQSVRAELDAAIFHLYGVSREDVDYILETFPIVKRKDEKAFGEFRTKRLILDSYDRLEAEGTVHGDRA